MSRANACECQPLCANVSETLDPPEGDWRIRRRRQRRAAAGRPGSWEWTARVDPGRGRARTDGRHYGGVEIDGLTAMVTMRVGKWARTYVADTATPEQAEAAGSVIPLALPFLGMGVIETVEVVPISVERTETMVKFAAPESTVEIEIVMGANGEPLRIANLPMKGSPFPEVHDHTQYRSVHSKHDSEAHHFEWSGRNGFVSKVDQAGGLPSGDS